MSIIVRLISAGRITEIEGYFLATLLRLVFVCCVYIVSVAPLKKMEVSIDVYPESYQKAKYEAADQ